MLNVVKFYKYMGVRTTASGDVLPEIAARYATTRNVIKPLKVKLFKTTSIAIKDKLHIAGSILLSRQFNGSGAWPELKTTERANTF